MLDFQALNNFEVFDWIYCLGNKWRTVCVLPATTELKFPGKERIDHVLNESDHLSPITYVKNRLESRDAETSH